MDWIDFKNSTPDNEQLIWGQKPSGSAVLGKYSFFRDHHRVYIEDGNYYLKIVKWATYDVQY